MVSYYNTLPYSQKHSAANPSYAHSPWPSNYHAPPNHQFVGEMDLYPHHQMYYSPQMFYTAGSSASDWHSPTSPGENFPQNATSVHQMLQHHHGHGGVGEGIGSGSGGGHNEAHGNGGSTSSGNSVSSGSNSTAGGGGGGGAGGGGVGGNSQLNDSVGEAHIAEGLPSPPITVSGSEISSPGAPASSSSPRHVTGHHHLNNNSPSAPNHNVATSAHNNNNNNNTNGHNNHTNRSSPVKAQYYDWMKKPSYPSQPAPGNYSAAEAGQLNIRATAIATTASHRSRSPILEDFSDLLDPSGKTRTKDKYRVVYTDYQRLELEKEYCTSRYITIRRKTELAQSLSLSERQVKIWFQNRRAKERKQNKKTNDPMMPGVPGVGGSGSIHQDYANMMDTKPKLEPGLHLQHSLHSMAALGMSGLGVHHHHHIHRQQVPMALTAAAHSHHMHQSAAVQAQMSAASAAAAAASGVGVGVGGMGM